MSAQLDLPSRLPLRAADVDLLNAVLSRFARPHPLSDTLSLRIRIAEREWSTPEVDLMTIGGAMLAYEWLALPPDLPPGLQLPPDRLAALPRAVRRLMSAMMLVRAAASWPGPRPEHAGTRPTSRMTDHIRLTLEFFRGDVPAGSLLVAGTRAEMVALARAAGQAATEPVAPDPNVTADVLPRIAALTVTAAEAEALSVGDVVLLGPLAGPFDALRIGAKVYPVRGTEDGGLILDTNS